MPQALNDAPPHAQVFRDEDGGLTGYKWLHGFNHRILCLTDIVIVQDPLLATPNFRMSYAQFKGVYE